MQTTQNKKFHNQSHREVRTQPSLFCYAIFYSSFIIPYIFRFENFPIKSKKCPAGSPAEHLIYNITFLSSFSINPDRSAAHNLCQVTLSYAPDIRETPTPSYLSTDEFHGHIPAHSRSGSDAFLHCSIHIHVRCKG